MIRLLVFIGGLIFLIFMIFFSDRNKFSSDLPKNVKRKVVKK